MTFRKTGIPDRSPVFWFAQLASRFSAEVPLRNAFPGSLGALCIDLNRAIYVGASVTSGGRAANVIPIPTAARSTIANASVIQQAFGFDSRIGAFHAGPGQISRF